MNMISTDSINYKYLFNPFYHYYQFEVEFKLQMADKRKSSRYSIAKELPVDSQENHNALGINILQYERKIQQKMTEVYRKCINDAEDNFKEKDFIQKYHKEQHLQLCNSKLSSFMDKLSCWIDNKVLSEDFLKLMQNKMNEKKKRRLQKVRRIEQLTRELSNQLKESCVQEAQGLLSQQLQEYKIKIKSQQSLKYAHQLFNKNNLKFNDYLKDLEDVHEKMCEKYNNLQNKYQ